jgi:hypothetical protein
MMSCFSQGNCASAAPNDLDIIPTDDEEHRCSHVWQRGTGQVGTTASQNDRVRVILALGCRNQRGGGTGTGAKIADRKAPHVGILTNQSVAPTSRSASSAISKRRWAVRASIASSSEVSRSISKVASFASLSKRATWRLRELCRLLPLP